MLKKCEDLIKERIRLEEEIELDLEEMNIYQAKIEYINSYYKLKIERNAFIDGGLKDIIIAGIVTIPFLLNILPIITLIIESTLYGIGAMQIYNAMKKNKELKQGYKDISGLTKEQIINEKELNIKLLQDRYTHIKKLREDIEIVQYLLFNVYPYYIHDKELKSKTNLIKGISYYDSSNENSKKLLKTYTII